MAVYKYLKTSELFSLMFALQGQDVSFQLQFRLQ